MTPKESMSVTGGVAAAPPRRVDDPRPAPPLAPVTPPHLGPAPAVHRAQG